MLHDEGGIYDGHHRIQAMIDPDHPTLPARPGHHAAAAPGHYQAVLLPKRRPLPIPPPVPVSLIPAAAP
jgi:hypothetical protein